MRCTECLSDNLPGRRYCGKCGNPLLFPCLHCGFGNSIGDHFCGGCGINLDEKIGTLGSSHLPSEIEKEMFQPQNLQNPFSEDQLTEILGVKGEAQKEEKEKKDPKKAVSQDDIDRLLKGSS